MLKLKPIRQTSGLCGPASLKMVLDYYGFSLSEKKLAKLAGAMREKGVSPQGLIKALKSLNFHGFWKQRGKIEDLKRFIKLGCPVIVDWFSEYEGHYSVVIGFEKDKIILMDPEIAGVKKFPIKEFKLIWWDFEGPSIKNPKKWNFEWMLVPSPKEMNFKIKGNYF